MEVQRLHIALAFDNDGVALGEELRASMRAVQADGRSLFPLESFVPLQSDAEPCCLDASVRPEIGDTDSVLLAVTRVSQTKRLQERNRQLLGRSVIGQGQSRLFGSRIDDQIS